MTVYRSIHEIIGQTPMLELTQFQLPNNVRLFAKLEYLNPGGSIKDRLGQELIEEALRAGKLKAGGTIIEPTAGNTGIGLALAAINRDIKVVFVVPEKFSIEKQEIMKALGAEIVNTPTAEGIEGAIRKTNQLL
ncbi:MAG: pyridoxal-phosphate dependent enzyme, partial [Mesobacillus sp.]|uniref:PLP-dependent cysteine synthase family protein n=1 Tax=Mesobacillus sp. TaxID=2675271 RepID=UPI003C527C8E